MLLVLFPFASVLGAIQMAIGAVAMCFIILPVAIIDVSIRMYQSSFPVRFIIGPVAFVEGAVGPDLDALALSDLSLAQPFSLVLGTALEQDHRTALSGSELTFKLIIVVYEVSKLLAHFLTDKSRESSG